MTAYSISKYGVEAFSDALRREMRPWGVNVSIIEAGAHKTKLVSGDVLVNQWQSLWDGLNEELKEEYGQEGLQKGKMPCYEKNCPLALPQQSAMYLSIPGALHSLLYFLNFPFLLLQV